MKNESFSGLPKSHELENQAKLVLKNCIAAAEPQSRRAAEPQSI
jgi:hypothetical protein